MKRRGKRRYVWIEWQPLRRKPSPAKREVFPRPEVHWTHDWRERWKMGTGIYPSK